MASPSLCECPCGAELADLLLFCLPCIQTWCYLTLSATLPLLQAYLVSGMLADWHAAAPCLCEVVDSMSNAYMFMYTCSCTANISGGHLNPAVTLVKIRSPLCFPASVHAHD